MKKSRSQSPMRTNLTRQQLSNPLTGDILPAQKFCFTLQRPRCVVDGYRTREEEPAVPLPLQHA